MNFASPVGNRQRVLCHRLISVSFRYVAASGDTNIVAVFAIVGILLGLLTPIADPTRPLPQIRFAGLKAARPRWINSTLQSSAFRAGVTASKRLKSLKKKARVALSGTPLHPAQTRL